MLTETNQIAPSSHSTPRLLSLSLFLSLSLTFLSYHLPLTLSPWISLAFSNLDSTFMSVDSNTISSYAL